MTKGTETYLLNAMKKGKGQANAFISGCEDDTNRLEKYIRNLLVIIFTTVNFIKRNKSKQSQKQAEAKETQDIFKLLLFPSL